MSDEHPRAPIIDADELARLRLGLAQAPPVGSPAAPVDPEQIWAAVHGELDDEARDALVDRLATDPELGLEWRLAAELARDLQTERDPARGDRRPAPADRSPRGFIYAGIGLAAAAVVLLVVLPRPSDPETPALRAGEVEAEAVLSTPLADREVLPRGDFSLRWSSRRPVSHYEVRVTTEALEPVFVRTYVEHEELLVPAEALAELAAGSLVLWRVEAVETDGTRHPSPVWRVELR